jgi:hypothetical protein
MDRKNISSIKKNWDSPKIAKFAKHITESCSNPSKSPAMTEDQNTCFSG